MSDDLIDSPAITLPEEDWAGPGAAATEDAALYLELDGWEGPLDLLLDLARRQKVDLRKISILALVDQYLTYIERAEALRLELAADYLVMAAWLAYLKSAPSCAAQGGRAGRSRTRGSARAAPAAPGGDPYGGGTAR